MTTQSTENVAQEGKSLVSLPLYNGIDSLVKAYGLPDRGVKPERQKKGVKFTRDMAMIDVPGSVPIELSNVAVSVTADGQHLPDQQICLRVEGKQGENDFVADVTYSCGVTGREPVITSIELSSHGTDAVRAKAKPKNPGLLIDMEPTIAQQSKSIAALHQGIARWAAAEAVLEQAFLEQAKILERAQTLLKTRKTTTAGRKFARAAVGATLGLIASIGGKRGKQLERDTGYDRTIDKDDCTKLIGDNANNYLVWFGAAGVGRGVQGLVPIETATVQIDDYMVHIDTPLEYPGETRDVSITILDSRNVKIGVFRYEFTNDYAPVPVLQRIESYEGEAEPRVYTASAGKSPYQVMVDNPEGNEEAEAILVDVIKNLDQHLIECLMREQKFIPTDEVVVVPDPPSPSPQGPRPPPLPTSRSAPTTTGQTEWDGIV